MEWATQRAMMGSDQELKIFGRGRKPNQKSFV
jgi:hypothetical protein